ncbi:hypothetical protein MLD38_023804 [Melastoma candidum]|uniref:Uncharacterized protein n=1 Tax=Melastoma candidum TaxID=119954 RepID=A0ACB9NVB8_9MYRT|nr:hypothetical protein MLD38_023804 [Melastoma candidum]
MGGGTSPFFPNDTAPILTSSSSSCSYNMKFPAPANSHHQCQIPGSSASAFPGGMVRTSALGPVPSASEVDKAICSLLGFCHGTSSEGWMDSLIGSEPRMLISSGLERFRRALHLLQTEPAFKMLVTSLASDKAFWDAVMNNEAVREVQHLLSTGENGRPRISEDVNLARNILSWFLEMLREKIMELVDKFKSLVNELMQPCIVTSITSNKEKAENKAILEEKVRSSFVLSVVILFIVVLARMTGT